jgi:hypothetical protein
MHLGDCVRFMKYLDMCILMLDFRVGRGVQNDSQKLDIIGQRFKNYLCTVWFINEETAKDLPETHFWQVFGKFTGYKMEI